MKHESGWKGSCRISGVFSQLNDRLDKTPGMGAACRMRWPVDEAIKPIVEGIRDQIDQDVKAMHRKGKR